MWRWLPTIWLAFVVVRYFRTATRTVLSPYNPGWDISWAIVWLGFALAIILSFRLLRRESASRLWAGLISAGGIAIVVLSGTAPAVFVGAMVLAVCAGLGQSALQTLGAARGPLLERLAIAVPIGIGLFALAQLALALAGLFNETASWTLLVFGGLLALPGMRTLVRLHVETGLSKHSAPLTLLGFVVLVNLTWSVAPEIQYDGLNVHLAVPRLYLQAGGLVELPYFFNSYFAHLLDMVFGACLALGGAVAAKFLVFGLGLLSAAAVYALGRRLFNDEVGVWAALVFYTTPLVVWSSSTTYLDLPLALFATASAIAYLKWHETRRWAWIAAGGWIAGVAVGTKVAAIATPAVFPVAAFVLAVRKRSGTAMLQASAYVLLLLIVAAPWHAVVYNQTGNPFFPLLNGIFQSPEWPAENTTLDWGSFGMDASLRSLTRLPFRLTWDTSRFGSANGALGLAPLLALPLALCYAWRGSFAQRVVLTALGVHAIVWVFTAQYARYVIPILPMGAVLGCAVFLRSGSRPAARRNRLFLLAAVIAQFPIASVLFWNIPERFPIGRALGRETEEAFLSRSVPGYRAAMFLNTIWKPGEKILAVDIENSRFYFDGPLHTQAYRTLPAFETPADLQAALAQNRFVYIVASRAALHAPPSAFGYAQPEFLAQFTEEIYRDDRAAVFRIRGR